MGREGQRERARAGERARERERKKGRGKNQKRNEKQGGRGGGKGRKGERAGQGKGERKRGRGRERGVERERKGEGESKSGKGNGRGKGKGKRKGMGSRNRLWVAEGEELAGLVLVGASRCYSGPRGQEGVVDCLYVGVGLAVDRVLQELCNEVRAISILGGGSKDLLKVAEPDVVWEPFVGSNLKGVGDSGCLLV